MPHHPRRSGRARFLAQALAVCLLAATASPEELRVRVGRANVREMPDTTARVVTQVARGTVLELLESAGEWFKVKTAAGVTGYVHATVVERLAPAAPPPTGAGRATAPAAAAAAAVAIAHDEVGCVVADQHPRFEACLSPDDAVARARVAFRAKGTDPWYYVEMAREGRCHAAVLPRPQRDIQAFEYFVDVIDRNFAESVRPERAPDRAFAPRVVGRKAECEAGRLMAAVIGQLARPVVVGVLRDASGRVLEAAAARSLESQMLLSGFSKQGVIVSSTGAAPGSAVQPGAGGGGAGAGGAAAGAAAAGGGIGAGTLAIAGGALAAAGVVAVAAGGGDGEEPLTATGHWTGSAASGGGLTTQIQAEGISCSFGYDIVADLTESNGALSGQISYNAQRLACASPDPVVQQAINAGLGAAGNSGSLPVGGTASGGTISLVVAQLTFNGSYTRTSLEATANFAIEGTSGVVYRLRLTRP